MAMAMRDKVLIGVCLLAIFIAILVLATQDDPSPSFIIPFVVIIFIATAVLCICGADAVRPGIFDSCADPADLERRDALREQRVTDRPV